MGELRLPGLATGIDTSALIQQLMMIESRRLATYQVKKADYQEQNTALSDLQSKVSALKTAVSALSDANDLEIFKTSSSTTTSSVTSLILDSNRILTGPSAKSTTRTSTTTGLTRRKFKTRICIVITASPETVSCSVTFIC